MSSSSRVRLLAASFALSLGMGLVGPAWSAEPGDGIGREGEGERRLQLNAMELKPFPAEAWSKLSEWQNGSALSPADTKGKVVLIYTWSSWYPPAQRVMADVQAWSSKYAKEGLIVVCAHDKEGWADAVKPKPAEGAKLLVALDAKNEFRAAILSDNDPDFYLIDRAGQLRYADVLTEAVEPGIKRLVAESEQEAGAWNDKIAKAKADADRELRKSRSIREDADLTAVPELPYKAPPVERYEAAAWPLPPMTDAQWGEYRRNKVIPPPKPFVMAETGWVPKKPNFDGRAALVYFFHPRNFTNSNLVLNLVNQLNLRQRQYGRDLLIIGAIYNPWESSNNGGKKARQEDTDPERVQQALAEFAKTNKVEHSFVLDLDNTMFKFVTPDQNNDEYKSALMVAVISSDGMMRWWGKANDTGLQAAMDKVVAVDPGVIVRRTAEEAWIKANHK